MSTNSVCLVSFIGYIALYYYFAIYQSNLKHSSSPEKSQPDPESTKDLTALQKHVFFWDRDGDNIIYPHHVYNGFREIGFSIPFSITSLLIPVFFAYPTRLGHSLIPDPLFRIYVDSIHKAKHGSDTGIYDSKGNFRAQNFEDMFAEFDPTEKGSLGIKDLLRLIGNNRVAADPAGWTFAAMEWSTTWLLLQRGGRIWKDDLMQCYDGTLFWRLKQEKLEGKPAREGYGWKDVFRGRLPELS